MRIFYIICFIVFVALQYSLFFSNNNILTFMELRNNQEDLNKKIYIIDEKNKLLKNEIQFMKENKKYLEIYAREKLGLIKDNETFFQIIKNAKE
ncbi:MAG: hypothetical protein CMD88_02605 [Gammaproteobacteria bacterium]|nr:hypothetical protein [Gammaproteobacteria bacterium]